MLSNDEMIHEEQEEVPTSSILSSSLYIEEKPQQTRMLNERPSFKMLLLHWSSQLSLFFRSDLSSYTNYPIYVLFLLLLIYATNQMDRNAIHYLWTMMRIDIPFSYSQYGLLMGYGFSLIYVSTNVVYGYLADRYSRKALLLTGMAIWSAMIVFQGTSESYTQLLVSRIGLGIGEAACNPTAYSLISDYFSHWDQPLANSIYTFGIFLGVGVSACLPTIALRYSWRWVFFILGFVGFALWLLTYWTLKEPQRGIFMAKISTEEEEEKEEEEEEKEEEEGEKEEEEEEEKKREIHALMNSEEGDSLTRSNHIKEESLSHPTTSSLLTLTANTPMELRANAAVTYYPTSFSTDVIPYLISLNCVWPLIMSAGMRNLGSYIFIGFMPAFLMAEFPGHKATVLRYFGLVSCVGGILSAFMGGYITKYWSKSNEQASIYLTAWSGLISCPLVFVIFFYDVSDMTSTHKNEYMMMSLMLVLLFLLIFVADGWPAPIMSFVQSLLPSKMQSTGIALYIFCSALISGAGPELMGILLELASKHQQEGNNVIISQKRLISFCIIVAYMTSSVGFLICARWSVTDHQTKSRFELLKYNETVSSRRRCIGYLVGMILLIGFALSSIYITWYTGKKKS
jgi:MFS family permease